MEYKVKIMIIKELKIVIVDIKWIEILMEPEIF